jgi:hypothetical protein
MVLEGLNSLLGPIAAMKAGGRELVFNGLAGDELF